MLFLRLIFLESTMQVKFPLQVPGLFRALLNSLSFWPVMTHFPLNLMLPYKPLGGLIHMYVSIHIYIYIYTNPRPYYIQIYTYIRTPITSWEGALHIPITTAWLHLKSCNPQELMSQPFSAIISGGDTDHRMAERGIVLLK